MAKTAEVKFVANEDGRENVDDLNDKCNEDYHRFKKEVKILKEDDWLKEERKEDWEERMEYHQKWAYITGEMAAWLSTLDQKTISNTKIADKLEELKERGSENNWEVQYED